MASSILVHSVFIVSLFTGTLDPLFHDTRYILDKGIDFFAFYQAGHNVLNGIDCYAVPDPLTVPYMFPYRYLAYFAYSFGAIFNLAPPVLAYWIWDAIILISVWLAAFRTRSVSKTLGRQDWEWRIGVSMWLIFSPVYIELYLGQVTLMAAILMFFALTSKSFVKGQGGNWTMTTLWTIGGLMKLIPFFIAPVLIAAGRVRSVLVAVAVFLVGVFAVPSALESLQFFLTFNSGQLVYVNPYIGNHSLKMLLYYLLGEPGPDFAVITGLIIGIFLVLTIGTTFYSRDVWACAGMFSLLFFFIMFDVWEHHYTFLLPIMVLMWIRGEPGKMSRWVPFILTLLMSIPMLPLVEFLAGAAPGVHPINLDPVWLIVYHSSKVVPALILYVWLMRKALQSTRDEEILGSTQNAYIMAWNNLIAGSYPTIEGGIIIQKELGTIERDK
ncbi:MAG: glycosyltransferase 87 family protein [Candidatus Thorarchaeota archaeon]